MSTVRRASATYLGNLAAVRAVQPAHDAWFRALADGITSATLAELHRSLDAAPVRDPQDLCAAFATVAGLVDDEVLPLPTFPPDGTDLVRWRTDLLIAVDDAWSSMAAHEQRATAEAIGLALHDLGYVIERAELDGVVTGFEASTADAKLLVEVTSGGAVVTDFIGLSDGASCGSAQADLAQRVGHYGVLLTEQDRDDHRDPHGGGLARRAARATGHTLAERIVAAHQGGSRRTTPRPRTARQVTA